ncbi:MAG: 2-dehydropantoate 2-reductase [Gemmatimonadales bacterium]
MRILIVGAGALGGYVGACLCRAGEDVTLLDPNVARARLLNEQGLLIAEAGQPEARVPVRVVTTVTDQMPFDLVFVAVKTYQTEAALKSTLPATTRTTRFLSMQNGVGNAEILARLVGPERVLCGITYHSIQHAGPGRLQYRQGVKPIQIAPFTGVVGREIEAIGELFSRAGLPTEVVAAIDQVIWQKLLHNAVINPVSALTGLSCREILGDEDLLAFMRDLTDEILAVMRARGISIIDEEDPFRPLLGSLRALGKNRPSMWQDLARGRRTEVDAINGAVLVEAVRQGLAAPHNAALVRFIHSRERQTFLKRQEITRRAEEAAGRVPPSVPGRPGPRGPDSGMRAPGPPLESTRRLRELIGDHYRDLDAASIATDRLVACCTSLGPVEILRALGMTPYVPENHAALIAASRRGVPYLARATELGYSQFANSAMRLDVGALLAGDSPLVGSYGVAGSPRPDLAVYSTNTGRALIDWFRFYGERYAVPVMGLSPPAELDQLESIDEQAVVQQMLRLVGRLETVAGQRLDVVRLAEIVRATAEASALWSEILDLARTTPTPLTFFDTLVQVAPMVLLRGTEDAVSYYRMLRDELAERVARGIGAVAPERYRCYWDGPPLWCALRPLSRFLSERGVAVVASTFAESFVLSGLDPDDPVASLARSYAQVFANRSDAFQLGFVSDQLDEYGIDFAVLHDCRTAPQTNHVRYGLAARLQRQTRVPAVVLEADSHDERLFSLDRFRAVVDEVLDRDEGDTGLRPEPGEAVYAGD